MKKRDHKSLRRKRSGRNTNKRRSLVSEKLESRQLLAVDIADFDFFSGAEFSDLLSADWTTAIVGNASADQLDANTNTSVTVPAFQIELPTQYDPLAQKIGGELYNTYSAATTATTQSLNGRSVDLVQQAAQDGDILIGDDNRVRIEIVANNSVEDVRAQLEPFAFEERAEFGNLLSGAISPTLLDDIAQLDSINFIRPIYNPVSNAGSVENEADRALRSDIAKTTYDLDGSGIKIGVLSDSYDTISAGGGAAGGISTGDLPGAGNPFGRTIPIEVLQELSRMGIDEGRAMLELLHDLVPGAALAFRTAFEGPADFAAGILELANAGADVIVDDITYFAEPFFQDGVIAQAAAQVVNQGIPFFSSAGNQGRDSYESDFRTDGAQAVIGNTLYVAHDFDPGPNVDNFQAVSVAPGRTATLSFQWDQPFASSGGAGSANDLDIFVFDQFGNIVASSTDSNLNGDAVEIVRISNQAGQSQTFQLLLANRVVAGQPEPGRVKYYSTGGPSDLDPLEFDTRSGTLFGHHQAVGGAGIAAADYRFTPEFGVSPAQPQSSTSAGGVPILFDTAGNRLAQAEIRQQPVVTGPDATNNTFFGSDIDGDGNPNFSGTSAAAPHIAGVAALLLEAAGGPGSLTPAEINQVLSDTALDILQPGFDFDTGAGFVDAEAAIGAVIVDNSDPDPDPGELDFFFSALNGTQRELYHSDGTTAGTGQVRNLAGSGSAAVTEITNRDGVVFFTARGDDGQRELYRSAGTSASTFQVRDLAGSRSSAPRDLTVFGNDLIFSAALADGQRELYRSGGTSATTSVLRNLSGSRSSNPTDITFANNKFFFVATTEDGDRELHVSDGTSTGTELVRNLFGTHSSRPENLTAVGGRLYFTALLPSGQRELFTSTGTFASTQLVRNLSGAESSDPQELTAVGNRLYFTARLPSGERELHISSGLSSNTGLVANLGGTRSANPLWLTERGGTLFFVATQPNGERELMTSTGTESGTNLVANLSGSLSSSPTQLTRVGNNIVFSARQSETERELYVSNGTAVGTFRIVNLNGTTNSNPTNLAAVGDQIVYSAVLPSGQRELHISDLTAAGTTLIRNIGASNSANPLEIVDAGSESNASGNAGGNASSNAIANVSQDDAESDLQSLLLDDLEPAQSIFVPQFFALDVNGDGSVSAIDALLVINNVGNATGATTQEFASSFLDSTDVNGDGFVSSLDALRIINSLNTPAAQPPELSPLSVDSFFADDEQDESEIGLLF